MAAGLSGLVAAPVLLRMAALIGPVGSPGFWAAWLALSYELGLWGPGVALAAAFGRWGVLRFGAARVAVVLAPVAAELGVFALFGQWPAALQSVGHFVARLAVGLCALALAWLGARRRTA